MVLICVCGYVSMCVCKLCVFCVLCVVYVRGYIVYILHVLYLCVYIFVFLYTFAYVFVYNFYVWVLKIRHTGPTFPGFAPTYVIRVPDP